MKNLISILSTIVCMGVSVQSYSHAGNNGPEINTVSNFTLAANGETCVCENAATGETGTLIINGIAKTFTKRTAAQLRALINVDQIFIYRRVCTESKPKK
jgi:predicted amidohydrolase